jgi:hypothetical protein
MLRRPRAEAFRCGTVATIMCENSGSFVALCQCFWLAEIMILVTLMLSSSILIKFGWFEYTRNEVVCQKKTSVLVATCWNQIGLAKKSDRGAKEVTCMVDFDSVESFENREKLKIQRVNPVRKPRCLQRGFLTG